MNVSQECKGKATPVQAPSAQGSWDFQISRQSAREGGKFVSRSTGRLYPQEIFLVSFLLEAEPTQGRRSAGMRQWKIPMKLSGIELSVPHPNAPLRAPFTGV